jgi:catechol 2,3-dioxygenase-like lactoylglutathione lyase family enzyme
MSAPLRLGHVGLCVRDIDAAAAWYRDVLGLELLDGPRDLAASDARSADLLRDVFGAGFRHARIAQLGLDGDTGLELFEFTDPAPLEAAAASYFRPGLSHLCFTAADPEAVLARAVAAGGRARTAVWPERADRPHRFVHFEDPFGNLLELHSHGNHETVAVAAS